MRAFLVTLAVLSLTACGSQTPVKLSVRVGAPTASSGAGLRQALDVGTGIQVDRVRVSLHKVRLEKVGEQPETETESAGTDAQHSSEHAEAGPLLLDLGAANLTGQVSQVVTLQAPAGDYEGVKIQVERPSTTDLQANAAFQELYSKEASIIVDGHIDSNAFSFATGVTFEQERKTAFKLGNGSDNITLSIDPSGWFNGSGGRLDPRVESNRSAIENNIQHSMDAYDDDNEDGAEDDGGGHDSGADDSGSHG